MAPLFVKASVLQGGGAVFDAGSAFFLIVEVIGLRPVLDFRAGPGKRVDRDPPT